VLAPLGTSLIWLLFNASKPMTEQISPLRQRMIDDMAFRNMSPNTQKVYAYAVANFARFHRQSPDKLGLEHVRGYRLHLISRGLRCRRSIRSSHGHCTSAQVYLRQKVGRQ